MKVVAFGASSSKKSINKTLAAYAASLLDGASVEVLDLNDYELPLFSTDKEVELGQPELAQAFLDKLGSSDAIIVSFAEHNGSYSAAFKNLFDWCSRITRDVYQGKPVLVLATSPGPGGGANVLSVATNSMSHFAGDVKGSFSLPSFYDNFDMENNLINDEALLAQLKEHVTQLAKK